MSKTLPTGKFKRVETDKMKDVHTIPDDAKFGYLLEVDLEYP